MSRSVIASAHDTVIPRAGARATSVPRSESECRVQLKQYKCQQTMADGEKRNIPIKLGDFSVIDTEFSNIRERFDAEMRKMEDEMTRFRSELMNRESNFFKTTSR